MTLGPTAAAELLGEARSLDRERAYPALARVLEPFGAEALRVEPELLFLRADVARRLGRREEALRDLETLQSTLGRLGNTALHRKRLNLLGSLEFEGGDVAGARDTWLAQLDDATEAGDEEFAARACNNLGVVATLHDRLPEALAYYARAVSAYLRVGYARGLGQAHHNMGITYREMGFLHEADTHFRTADRFARSAASDDEVARVAQERALLLFLMGDAAMARHTADRALRTYHRLQDPAGAAEVHRVLGLVALGEGALDEAARALGESLTEARRLGHRLLEGEVLAARAALAAARGHPDDADRDDTEADRLFDGLGAPGWGRRARERARALAARGSTRTSRN